jgi:hypothetical protein
VELDVFAIFCLGDGYQCEGCCWAFPVDEGNALIDKHHSLTPMTTNN